jgi:ParB family chromosome partitioning protein
MEKFSAAKTTRGNLYQVSPLNIVVVDGFNSRQDFGDLTELAEQIKEQGVLNPITVQSFKDKDGVEKYRLVDGERRYRAVMKLLKDGVDIQRVPAIIVPKNLSQEELLIQQVLRNEGKKFNDYEMGVFCQKLMQVCGYTKSEVARKIGKTNSQVSIWLSLLDIDNEELREEMKNNNVTGDVVRKVLRANQNDEQKTLDEIRKAKEKAQNNGKTRVTLKDVEGNVVVQKASDEIKRGIGQLFKYINKFTEENTQKGVELQLDLQAIYDGLCNGKTIDVILNELAVVTSVV